MSREDSPGPSWKRVCGLLAALALSACAGQGALAPGSATAERVDVDVHADETTQALRAFELQQRAAAQAAEQQGQWATAAWAWEALHALQPADETIATRLRQARTAADSRATLLTQQARLAWQLKDMDSARDLFMRALMSQPGHLEAVDGLRRLEDTRLRSLLSVPDPIRSDPPRTASLRTHSDFARLLVAQGELERAVGLLLPLASARPGDPALRQQLSDIYLLLAESQRAKDPALALANVRKSLQMDRRNSRAASRLREWQRTAAPAVPLPRVAR